MLKLFIQEMGNRGKQGITESNNKEGVEKEEKDEGSQEKHKEKEGSEEDDESARDAVILADWENRRRRGKYGQGMIKNLII